MIRRLDPAAVLARTPSVKATLARHDNRGPGFDTIRLVAASAVALHHAMGIQYDIVLDDPIHAFSGGYTHLGLMAVCVFFALSGFLVTPGLVKNGDVIAYISRRFMRIMPLLALVVVATALVVGPLITSLPTAEYFASAQTWEYLRNITTSLSTRLPGVVTHGGGNEVNNPLWTLRYEWLCYLLIAAACFGGILRRRGLFLAGWLAVLVILPLSYGIPSSDREGSGQVYTLMLLFGYFGAGVLAFLYADVLRWSPFLLAGAFIALLGSLWSGLGFLLAPALTTYLVIGLGLVRFPWGGILARADLSYGVYLMHAVILTILVNAFEFSSGLALFAVGLPLSLLAALASWTFVEKPALRAKDLPAKIIRTVLGRNGTLAGRETGAMQQKDTPR